MMERRIGRRYDLSFPVKIHPPGSSVPGLQSGCTRDISARGVYFTVNEDLAVGAKVNFIVTVSAEMADKAKVSVRARGRVVRIDKARDYDHESTRVAVVIEWYDIFRGEPAHI